MTARLRILSFLTATLLAMAVSAVAASSASAARTKPLVTLNAGVVTAGRADALTLNLRRQLGTCAVDATSPSVSIYAFPSTHPTREHTRWAWRVPTDAKSSIWHLTLSCGPTLSNNPLFVKHLSIRILSRPHGGKSLTLATSASTHQSGPRLLAAAPLSRLTCVVGICREPASGMETTPTFVGYDAVPVSGTNIQSDTASWTVPTASCTPGSQAMAAQWPGIYGTVSLQQDGTMETCFNGQPSYYAWYDMYGDPNWEDNNWDAAPLPAVDAVSPGDKMTGVISVSGDVWTLSLVDATRDWNFSIAIAIPNLTPAEDDADAEWLAEEPQISDGYEGLADFGSLAFTDATATLANGSTGSISSPLFYSEVENAAQDGVDLATAGPLSDNGKGFTITWDSLGPVTGP